MSISSLDQRAKAGKSQLGLCVAALMGVYLFALGFSWAVTKNIKMDGPMIAIGIVLLMLAREGQQWARIMVGCWVGLLALGQFATVGAQILRDHVPSAWAPFHMVIGFIYLVGALVLLISPDIRAYERSRERGGEGEEEWEPVAPEPSAAPPTTPNESFRPPSSLPAMTPTSNPSAAPAAPAKPAATSAPRLSIPVACPTCNRLSPAGSTACTKCGKPFPVKATLAPST